MYLWGKWITCDCNYEPPDAKSQLGKWMCLKGAQGPLSTGCTSSLFWFLCITFPPLLPLTPHIQRVQATVTYIWLSHFWLIKSSGLAKGSLVHKIISDPPPALIDVTSPTPCHTDSFLKYFSLSLTPKQTGICLWQVPPKTKSKCKMKTQSLFIFFQPPP